MNYSRFKNFTVLPSSGMLRCVVLVRTDVSEELSASIIKVTRIGELGTLAVTSSRHALQRNTKYLLVLTRATQCNIPEDSILQVSFNLTD
jgi:hypothetical protein